MPKESPDKLATNLQYGRGKLFDVFSDLAFKDRLGFLKKYKSAREDMNERWFGTKSANKAIIK